MTDVPTALMNMVPTMVAADVVTRVADSATRRGKSARVVKVVVVKKATKPPKMKYPKMRLSKRGAGLTTSKNVYRSKSGAMSRRRTGGAKRVRYS